MSFLTRIFGSRNERDGCRPLYDAAVRIGRDPAWYVEGQVPDTLDGRFDILSSVLAMIFLRLERDEAATREASVLLTELFVADMDGTVRQIGIGDLMVGKHVGKMMGALGGRIGAYREAVNEGDGFETVVRRNVFHDAPPSEEAVRFVSTRLGAFHAALAAAPLEAVLRGEVPRP